MRRDSVHFVYGIYEGLASHATFHQFDVKDWPAHAGPRKSEGMFSLCLGTEDHFRPPVALLKGASYATVTTNATGKNERGWHMVRLLETTGQVLPGDVFRIGQLDSSFVAMARQVKDVVRVFRCGPDCSTKQTRIHNDPIGCLTAKQPNNFFHHIALPSTLVEVFRKDRLRNECFQFNHRRQDSEKAAVTVPRLYPAVPWDLKSIQK